MPGALPVGKADSESELAAFTLKGEDALNGVGDGRKAPRDSWRLLKQLAPGPHAGHKGCMQRYRRSTAAKVKAGETDA